MFLVERSIDGIEWTSLHSVRAKNNISVELYKIIDGSP
jgi:hypothetical protein